MELSYTWESGEKHTVTWTLQYLGDGIAQQYKADHLMVSIAHQVICLYMYVGCQLNEKLMRGVP